MSNIIMPSSFHPEGHQCPLILYASGHIDSACKIDALMIPKETLAYNCLFFEDLSASLEVT
ncbi:MAG: hypothetical protein IKV80_01420 [Bacteroidales bacterium]|nr:hypothetical protein [Bacteroidales bacterium]